MRDLKLEDLLDLVVANVPDGEQRIEKIFEWHYDRVKITSQWILGATASLIISVLVAFSRAELSLPLWQTSLILLSAFATGTYGIYGLWQLRLVHRQFVATLKLFEQLKEIRTFLVRYRHKQGS